MMHRKLSQRAVLIRDLRSAIPHFDEPELREIAESTLVALQD